jgi:Uma2 family endonuclease
VLLVIEVSHSSLSDDKQRRAPVYAALGVAEYSVVNAVTLETAVFREPTAGGYTKVAKADRGTALEPALIHGFSLRLAGLDLE